MHVTPSPRNCSSPRSRSWSRPGPDGCVSPSTARRRRIRARWPTPSPSRSGPAAARRSWSTPPTTCVPRRCGWSSGARTRTCSSTAGSTSAACAARCSNPRHRAGRAGCCPGCGTPTRTAPTATVRRRCPRTASSCSPARCCWAAGCPWTLAVHLRMTEKALARRLPDERAVDAAGVRALRGGEHARGECGSGGAGRPSGPTCGTEVSRVGEEGVEPSRPYGHTDLNRARLPFRHSPWRSKS